MAHSDAPPAPALPIVWDAQLGWLPSVGQVTVTTADPSNPLTGYLWWPTNMIDDAEQWDAAQRKAARTRP